ncbi:XRCC3-like protein [Mya arenaria]|uniref:XRCC3-like protein n=1 Tax=Mya arenaria TaxID=6604 RepID=A0ABY7FDQ2_MYAAR|nr:DNA repair protein XRCC3-like isoform X1 [Mya arenaria]WAR19499.1 XRCC3-like protein [Mya arenaria]
MSEIDDLDVQQRLKNALRRSRLTTLKSILYLTEPVGNLGAEDIQTIKIAAAKKLSVLKPVTALELHKSPRENQRLTTGCGVLDQALRGGLLCRGITEISGESSSGKTQFALQLSLTAQLAPLYGGLDAGTLYICTEDAFPSKRLYQMIENFTSRHGKKLCTHGNLGDKIFIEHVPDFDSLMHCLTHKAPVLLKSGAIKLIVVDSIAAHFRSDYEGHEMYKRAQHIGALGTLLYTHSHEYNIPVVCINQVTSSMKPEGRQLIPSLGLSWSSQVTTRIMLTRTDRSLTIQQESARGPLETVVREMEIVYAPHLPPLTVPYVIDHEGMKGFA